MERNYSEMGKKGGLNRWQKLTPKERSKEMSRRRKMGYEAQQAKLKAIREESI